ncbi:MAG: AAA family ATPase, partial [Planctomycetes bacterium]|nr:AAA family ATPase [Planctomycetota bacterium]
MNSKPQLLIKNVHLENFVLHKDTFVEFVRPIVLLTGGNSSGKTLFLEGCLLALGIKSQRIRDGKLNAIVGSNGKVTRGTVQLNNPLINNRRTICFDNEQIDEMLDNEVFSLGFEVSAKDTNLNYFIINDDIKHTITLSLLTQILDRINLDIKNKLVFTESGDVSELVSSSPRKRFETLLRITGMQERFVQVSELSQKSADLSPMLQRLEEENKRREIELNNLKRLLEEIKEKERLEERNTFLEGTLLWCEYLQIKEKINKIRLRNADLEYQEKELLFSISQENIKLEKVLKELVNLNAVKFDEERSRIIIVREENDLKHEIDALQSEI